MKMRVTRWYDREWPEVLVDTCDRMTVNNEGFATLWEGENPIAMFPAFRILIVEMTKDRIEAVGK